jgi:hypothetical protein
MIRNTNHEPCANPFQEFHVFIPFNTDGNMSSGIFGGEFAIVAGPLMLAYFGVPVLILDSDMNPLALPSYAGLEPGSTQFEFGLEKVSIGAPQAATSIVVGLTPDFGASIDAVPDQPVLPWLEVPRAHLSVGAGSPEPLEIHLVADSAMAGMYAAKILFETSDPDRPLVELPVALSVEPIVPIALGPVSAQPTGEGVELQWEAPSLSEDIGFLIYRREVSGEPGEEVLLFEEPIRATRTLILSYMDRTAPAGADLRYRLVGLGPQGEVLAERMVVVSTRGVGRPLALWLGGGIPNPAAGAVIIRYGLPERTSVRLGIFDLGGRIIRSIENGGPRDSGYHTFTWDGRDDRGRLVAAGVYVVRIEAMDSTVTRKLIRLL